MSLIIDFFRGGISLAILSLMALPSLLVLSTHFIGETFIWKNPANGTGATEPAMGITTGNHADGSIAGNATTNHLLAATGFTTDKNSLQLVNATDRLVTDRWLLQCALDLGKRKPKAFHTEWRGYRLGDCIKLCQGCNYPYGNNTLANDYWREACPRKNANFVSGGNLTVVQKLFQDREGKSGFSKPDPEVLVIHLRLGDVIEKAGAEVGIMLTQGASPAHAGHFRNAIKSAHEYLSDTWQSGSTRVVIIGGSHFPELCKKSRIYAGCLERAFKKEGFDVTMQLDGGEADKDFYFMSNAKKILVSSGGYSRLIGKLVKMFGGLNIGRTF